MSLELILLRHGTVQGRSGVFRGSSNPPLGPEGWAQMNAIAGAPETQGINVVFTSPLRRCREPASMLAERLNAELHVLDDLREIDFGRWEELSPAEVAERWLEDLAALYEDPARTTPEGGEPFANFRRRVVSAFEQRVLATSAERVLVVTHGGVIRVILSHTLKLDMTQALRIALPPASRCTLSIEADRTCMMRALTPPPSRSPS